MKPPALILLPLVVLTSLVLLAAGTRSDAEALFVRRYVAARLASPPAPYLEYRMYGGSVVTDSVMPPVLPSGRVDYGAVFARHDLCALATGGQIDEVWIWAGNGDGVSKGHMWEWTTSGADWYGDAPDCGKVLTTMTFNYLREVDVALESFNHRLEGFFSHYFPCDLSTATWPWTGSTVWPFSSCGSLLSDRYGFVARPFSGNGYVAGCGDAHHPPNILTDASYVYNDASTVQTICPTWSQDGSATPTTVNCQAWGCSHWGFHIWWMQNVPGLNNINRDRSGGQQRNWWSYLFGPPPWPYTEYLPLTLNRHTGGATSVPSRPVSAKPVPDRQLATEPARQYSARISPSAAVDKPALHSGSTLSSLPAVTTRTVYVLYYPGYGGTPRADIGLLTNELIGLLKEAAVYHGYEYDTIRGSFLGQDGRSYAGRDCASGNAPDNIHIHLEGLRSGVAATGYRIEDPAGGGLWATPCTGQSGWLLYVVGGTDGQAELYIKPFRDAPDGTNYVVTVQYDDGSSDSITLVGSAVQTLVASFIGQDGASYAGQGCAVGTNPDNVHIRLYGLKGGAQPVSYRVDDFAGGGVWATPCNPVSNWMLYVGLAQPDRADLYFKPFRDAPSGTIYTVTVRYGDGSSQIVSVTGNRVVP